MPPILVEFPQYNGGDLLLAGTMVIGSGGVDVLGYEILVLCVERSKNSSF